MEKALQRSDKNGKAAAAAAAAARAVKQKVEMDGGGGGSESAMVAVAAAEDSNTSRARISAWVDKAKMDCPLCTLPLKPPIFLCDAGHKACIGCRVHALLSQNKCYACGLDGSYGRNPAFEEILLSVKVPCPYDCGSHVAYCELADHQRCCPCAPCRCPEKGCPFVGSPPTLIDHIAAQHSHHRAVVAVRYGQELELAVTPALRWRALVGQEDRTLFLVSLGAIGQVYAASLVCVRANAGAGAEYRCRLGVEVSRGEVAVMEAKVPSSGCPGEAPALGERAFLGLYQPVDDTVTLIIRIDQLQPAASAGAALASTATGMSAPPTQRSMMQH